MPMTGPQSAKNTHAGSTRCQVPITKPKSTELKKCFSCSKTGHLMRDCRKLKEGNSGSNHSANTTQVTVESEVEAIPLICRSLKSQIMNMK